MFSVRDAFKIYQQRRTVKRWAKHSGPANLAICGAEAGEGKIQGSSRLDWAVSGDAIWIC